MNGFILIGPPGPFEIIIIVIILLLLFGGKKIPELMRGLGQGMKEFKKATKEEDPPKKENDNSKSIESDKSK
ncbi:MAG: twin-arginine translocase TatA/TatE family subunit [Bacteroidales bacterium]|nr:twin-arginine translocase TatA/TatE family subunit [Bacteroidales bacterium]